MSPDKQPAPREVTFEVVIGGPDPPESFDEQPTRPSIDPADLEELPPEDEESYEVVDIDDGEGNTP